MNKRELDILGIKVRLYFFSQLVDSGKEGSGDRGYFLSSGEEGKHSYFRVYVKENTFFTAWSLTPDLFNHYEISPSSN